MSPEEEIKYLSVFVVEWRELAAARLDFAHELVDRLCDYGCVDGWEGRHSELCMERRDKLKSLSGFHHQHGLASGGSR